MTFRRVLFVDFDGVLHPSGGPPGQALPFEWVPVLAKLLAPFPDVSVAVHSSWREQFAADLLRDFLEPMADRMLDGVPPGPKAVAITTFLHAHPEIEDAAVLDDQPADVFGAGVRVLACDPLTGISSPEVQAQLRTWLERGR